MKLYFFRTLFSIMRFFHLESRIPQLRQTDVRDLVPNRLFYHYGRIICSCRNPMRHGFKYRVTHNGESYVTDNVADVERARANGAIIDEEHYNLPCHLCDIKKMGLPCCVCNMDVYFRIVDELKQHGCK